MINNDVRCKILNFLNFLWVFFFQRVIDTFFSCRPQKFDEISKLFLKLLSYLECQNQLGDLVKFLWPSQNIWALTEVSMYFKNYFFLTTHEEIAITKCILVPSFHWVGKPNWNMTKGYFKKEHTNSALTRLLILEN